MRYPVCEQLFLRHQHDFIEVLLLVERFQPELARFGGAPPAPRFEQDWFARADLAVCYSIVRKYRPRRIIEVGSGHSTRVLARACHDGSIDCQITCIDPSPRAALLSLDVTHIGRLLQHADQSVFDTLESDDILFIDSSHLAFAGTDVDILFNHVVPRLPPGTLIHVHDILLPEPYPNVWGWRGYNEQLLVATLLGTGAYTPVFASHFAVSIGLLDEFAPRLAAMPLREGVFETSLWMRKGCPAIG